MNYHRVRAAALAFAFAFAAIAGVAAAPPASATTYTWSSWANCRFITDAGTVVATDHVRWRINNTGSSRRIDWVEIQDPTNGSSRIDSATFAQLNGSGTRVGAGAYYKSLADPLPYNISLGQLNTTQMPYVSNNTPMQVQFHLHRIEKPGQECVYRHSY